MTELSPKQRELLDALLLFGRDRPTFDPALSDQLKAHLSTGLEGIGRESATRKRFVVGKYALQQVLLCEGRYEASLSDTFEWTPQNVRGRVAHRAIERFIISGGKQPPFDLAETAIERLSSDEDGWGPGEFLRSLDEEGRLDLVSTVGDIVTKFCLDWPPIERSWMPRVESAARFPVLDGRIELNTKADLVLGAPRGAEARTFVVDLKTGRRNPVHQEDLRFYALVETLVRGVPPFRVASYYLDSGTYDFEDITPTLLFEAAERTIAGAKAMWRVQSASHTVEYTPNPLCPYCPAFADCDAGQDKYGD
jgi:hypothetical protein